MRLKPRKAGSLGKLEKRAVGSFPPRASGGDAACLHLLAAQQVPFCASDTQHCKMMKPCSYQAGTPGSLRSGSGRPLTLPVCPSAPTPVRPHSSPSHPGQRGCPPKTKSSRFTPRTPLPGLPRSETCTPVPAWAASLRLHPRPGPAPSPFYACPAHLPLTVVLCTRWPFCQHHCPLCLVSPCPFSSSHLCLFLSHTVLTHLLGHILLGHAPRAPPGTSHT